MEVRLGRKNRISWIIILIIFRVLQHSEDKREFVKSLIKDVVKKVMGVCRDLENLKTPVQCDLIYL